VLTFYPQIILVLENVNKSLTLFHYHFRETRWLPKILGFCRFLPLLFEDNRFLDDFFPLHLNIYNFIKMYITLELPLSNESIKKLKDVTGFGR
jgi:hypothetical protein